MLCSLAELLLLFIYLFIYFLFFCKPYGFLLYSHFSAVYHRWMVEAGTLFPYLKKKQQDKQASGERGDEQK
jgi:hypothetical protein